MTKPIMLSRKMNVWRAVEILRELGPADRLDRTGEMPAGIADREANRLRSHVQAGEFPAIRQRSRRIRSRYS